MHTEEPGRYRALSGDTPSPAGVQGTPDTSPAAGRRTPDTSLPTWHGTPDTSPPAEQRTPDTDRCRTPSTDTLRTEKTPDPCQPRSVTDPGSAESLPILADERKVPRGQWSRQLDFMLSIIGYAVGLGNIWRFPYLCYKNGGGAFLVPYCLMLFTTALPLLCLELSVGQYASLGPSQLFQNLSPLFAGVGYGMILVTFFIVCYYNLIMAWAIFYTVASFRSTLGWSNCGHDYNTISCFTVAEERACLNSSDGTSLFWNKTCYPISSFCAEHGYRQVNATHCSSLARPSHLRPYTEVGRRISASEDYFTNYVLGLLDHWWDDYGELKWDLCLCLLAAWLVVGLCLIRGVKSSGKVVYFTALFPYIVLVILLVRSVTLEGSADGIAYYITPNTTRLADSRVWSDAATQIFYSFGLSLGGSMTLASYNRFNNNCMRDAVLVGFINCATSVFAGFVVFAVLGFMAKSLGTEVSDVVTSGSGLTFIAYPEAVVHMPVSPLWAVLFFIMIITLGLDSQFAMVETLLTALYDQWPSLRRRKAVVVSIASLMGFLLSLSMCAQGGIHLFTLMDWYSGSWSLLVLALLEVVIVAWVFGADRMLGLMQHSMGIRIPAPLRIYWLLTWRFVSPLCIIAILVFSVVQYVPAYYGTGDTRRVYPGWANGLGWIIALAPLMVVLAMAAGRIHRSKKTWRELLEPTANWCPAADRPGSGSGSGPGVRRPQKASVVPTVEITVPTDGGGDGVPNPAFIMEQNTPADIHTNGTSQMPR